jgi:hypothetical protein
VSFGYELPLMAFEAIYLSKLKAGNHLFVKAAVHRQDWQHGDNAPPEGRLIQVVLYAKVACSLFGVFASASLTYDSPGRWMKHSHSRALAPV